MKWSLILALSWSMAAGGEGRPAVPLAPDLLPAGTLAAFSVPDAVAAQVLFRQNPWFAAWQEPAMAPFRNRLARLWSGTTNASPGQVPAFPWAEVAQLASGAITVAVVPEPPGTPTPLEHPAVLAWMDVGSDAPKLRRTLEDYRVRLVDAGREVRIATIRGLRCYLMELPLPQGASWVLGQVLALRAAPFPEIGSTNPPVVQWWLAETNTLVIAATSSNAVAGVLDRLAQPPPAETLGADPLFAAQAARRIGRSTASAWIDVRPWMTALHRRAVAQDRAPQTGEALPMPKWTNILAASGLDRMQCVTLSWRETAAGTRIEVGLGVPADAKRGLFGMLAIEPGDASVPGEVPADVLGFVRLRLDFRQAWSALERMLEDVFPTARGVLDLLFKTANPAGGATDLRAELVAALGDDLWQIQPNQSLNGTPFPPSSPSLYRLSSTNAAGLVDTLKALTVLLPPSLGELQVDHTHRRTAYTIGWPQLSLLESPGTTQQATLTFCADEDGVLFSGDRALLRLTADTNAAVPPSLRDLAGIREAAEVIGGTAQGGFGYANTQKRLRGFVDALRRETNFWAHALVLTPAHLAGNAPLARLQEALDFTRLPSFDSVERHFGFRVLAVGRDDLGYFYRTYWPRPEVPAPPSPLASPSSPSP